MWTLTNINKSIARYEFFYWNAFSHKLAMSVLSGHLRRLRAKRKEIKLLCGH